MSPGNSTSFPDEKTTPHVLTHNTTPPPSYAAHTITLSSSPSSCLRRKPRWPPVRCARYDRILHYISLILGLATLALYIYDLAKSLSYHLKLPVGLTVVDSLSIAFLAINNIWSATYFAMRLQARMSDSSPSPSSTSSSGYGYGSVELSSPMSRKWPSILDLTLHCCLVGMADTTLASRSSDGGQGSDCDDNRAVGGCLPQRRGVMIAAGVLCIIVSVAAQLRFVITMHAAAERRKLKKAADKEAAAAAAANGGNLAWSNEIIR